MSASLVGSEMCIRDRPRGTPRPRATRLAASRLTAQRCYAGPFLGCVAPVSYTHLTLPTICSV
eukprot:10578911-Alexandrium_andersonii.AAC.1